MALSTLPQTEVALLEVVPPIEGVIMMGRQEITLDQQWETQKTQILQYLRSITARPEWRGVNVCVAVEMRRPAETILAFADKHGVDRIVMSTHGRTGVRRWVVGSGADKACPTSQSIWKTFR